MQTPTPAAIAAPTEPDRNELVSIFNKNPPGGDFVHHIYEPVKDSEGRIIRDRVKTEFRAAGRDFSNVPRWIAELWKKQNPGIIVDGQSISRGNAAIPVPSEQVSAALAENAELKKSLANLESMVAELQTNPEGKP